MADVCESRYTTITNETSKVNAVREEYKRYKKRNPPPDFSNVIDFENPETFRDRVQAINLKGFKECLFNCPNSGLRNPSDWRVFEVLSCPGFLFIINPFKRGVQHYFVQRSLLDFPSKPNVTNIDAHVTLDCQSVWESRRNSDPKPSNLLDRLRWAHLGYHFDYNNVQYQPEIYYGFPTDLAKLTCHIATALGYPSFQPEAGIVNYYPLGSSMGGHVDKYENDLSQPLISLSFGQPAVYLIGGKTTNVRPAALFVKSGDIIVMTGESRLAYHAVPCIVKVGLTDEPPECLTWDACDRSRDSDDFNDQWDKIYNHDSLSRTDCSVCKKCHDHGRVTERSRQFAKNKEDWQEFASYLAKTRININFLYGSKTVFRTSQTCELLENEHDKYEFVMSSLVALLNELETKKDCKFDEKEWSRVKNRLKLGLHGQRMTKEGEPDIFIIPNFLTPEQCRELVNFHQEISRGVSNEKWTFATIKQLLDAVHEASLSPNEYNISVDLQKSLDARVLHGVKAVEKMAKILNFSSSVLIPRGENVLVDSIEQYIQEFLGLPRTNAFHTQLLKYQTNSEYKAHTDCHGIENDRMATIIIYLTDVDEGGETNFPYLNQHVKPKRGMAVVWKNLDIDGQCDIKTTHVASRVVKGEKYIYQKWFYQEPILPQYQHNDYVYCDLSQSCRQYIYNKSTTLAVQYMRKGQESSTYIDALQHYKQALHHQPKHAGSLILYADILNALGHSRKTLPHLLGLLKMHSRNKDVIEILRAVVDALGRV